MKKYLLILLYCIGLIEFASAQLQYVPAITNRIYDSTASLSGMHALVNTKDFGFTIHPTAPPAKLTSVQLIDVGRPYPPVIYQTGTDDVNLQATLITARSDFFTDFDLQQNGQLTYVRASVAHGNAPLFYATMLYDTLTLAIQRIDNIPLLDGHDYRVNSKGEVLYAQVYYDTTNISCLSGIANDTAVIQTQRIIVKDSTGAVIFSWTPLDSDFTVCEMRYYAQAAHVTGSLIPIDWSHFNSAMWANDSNIIVSFRFTGVFKINVHTGHVAWKLGGLDTNAIPVPDSLMYFAQHDFLQLPDGRYTVFSDGDDVHRYMEGLTYDIDEMAKTARLVDRYRSPDTTYSIAMGSYRQYGNDRRLINYGWYVSPTLASAPPNLFCDILDSSYHVIASLVSPYDQIPYRAVPTAWSPEHLRPSIVQVDTTLAVDLPAGSHYMDVRWYDMPDDSTTLLVDSGLVLVSPIAGHTYVADAYIDSNTDRNWRITSTAYLYMGPTAIGQVSLPEINVLPNPARGTFHIINTSESLTCTMYNAVGMRIGDLAVRNGDNVYEAPEVSGVYVLVMGSGGVFKLIVE